MSTCMFNFRPDSAHIVTAERRLSAAYSRVPGAQVPVVEAGGFTPRYTVRERFDDFDKMLEHTVEWANTLAATDNDWPPFLDAWCTVPMVPEAFGASLHFRDQDIGVHPAIADISQVRSLKPKPLSETPTIRKMFDWIDYAQRKLGTDVPVWTADIQSPFSVACQVVTPTEFLTACFTDPEAVHHLCRMITDYTLDLMTRHIAQMENPCFPGRNFPSIREKIGICIADDTPLIMLSPEMYREFAFPYNAELSRAFGGVHIHCCGEYRANLDNLLALPGIRSIQVHAGPGEFELPLTAGEDHPFNRARRQVACFVDSNEVTRADVYRNKPREHYAEYVLPRLKNAELTGIILQSCGVCGDVPDVATALSWTRHMVAGKA